MTETPSEQLTGNDSLSTSIVYDEAYYATYENDSDIPYERSAPWLDLYGYLASRIVAELEPTSALDIGCAWGFMVEALRDRGVDAYGTDISEYGISMAANSAVGYCTVQSATQPVGRRFDLITSIEMIEHLSAEDGRVALKHMTDATDRILLSTTPFHFHETTHFNVQPPQYWAEIMSDFGFFRDVDYDASYLNNWAALFVRKQPTTRQLVHAYERSEWRYRDEALQLRREVVKLSDDNPNVDYTALTGRLEETTNRVVKAESALRLANDAAAGAEASRGVLQAQVRELQNHLGAAQAHQAAWDEMDTHEVVHAGAAASLRLEEARNELEAVKTSTSWRLIWLLLTPYRKLRGLR